MSQVIKYDDVLASILVNEKSILGFLSTIFGFLARRTDFYYVPEGPYENVGFPAGVAEELVIKVLRACNPNIKAPNGARKPTDLNNEIMCSTVAQEIEVIADGDEIDDEQLIDPISVYQYAAPPPISPKESTSNCNLDKNILMSSATNSKESANTKKSDNNSSKDTKLTSSGDTTDIPEKKSYYTPDGYKPPLLPTQKNSETYNGAERGNYCWSQNIMELEVTIRLPGDIKSSKDLKVAINAGDISVARKNGEVIVKDTLPWKIKALDSFWSLSEGKLLMHLEKVQERWWNKLLDSEEAIDLDKIDCSRPLDELPQDHIDKVRELQWNQDRKMKGLPTSDEMRNIEILKKAWNAPGSPFAGQDFDPSVLNKNLEQ